MDASRTRDITFVKCSVLKYERPRVALTRRGLALLSLSLAPSHFSRTFVGGTVYSLGTPATGNVIVVI